MSGAGTFAEKALLPLRRYADFSGRSTRTELIAFYALIMILGLGTYFAFEYTGMADGWPAWIRPTDIVWLAMLCPWIALCVRRLHDSGRSGWWLSLALPAVAVDAYQFYHHMPDRFVRVTDASDLPGALCMLALIVLLLWKDEEGDNAYGPNPRYEEPGRTAGRPDGAA